MPIHAGERGLQLKPDMNFTGFGAEELRSFTADSLRKVSGVQCVFVLGEYAL